MGFQQIVNTISLVNRGEEVIFNVSVKCSLPVLKETIRNSIFIH